MSFHESKEERYKNRLAKTIASFVLIMIALACPAVPLAPSSHPAHSHSGGLTYFSFMAK